MATDNSNRTKPVWQEDGMVSPCLVIRGDVIRHEDITATVTDWREYWTPEGRVVVLDLDGDDGRAYSHKFMPVDLVKMIHRRGDVEAATREEAGDA